MLQIYGISMGVAQCGTMWHYVVWLLVRLSFVQFRSDAFNRLEPLQGLIGLPAHINCSLCILSLVEIRQKVIKR